MTIKEGKVHLPGYDVVRKDHKSNDRNDDGVCIYFLPTLSISGIAISKSQLVLYRYPSLIGINKTVNYSTRA